MKPVETKSSHPKTSSKQKKATVKKPPAEVPLSPLVKVAESLTDEQRQRLLMTYKPFNSDWRSCKDIKEKYNISWNDLKEVAWLVSKTFEPIKQSVVGQLAVIKAEQSQKKPEKILQKKQTLSIDK